MKSRKSTRKRIRKNIFMQNILPMILFLVLLVPGFVLPHYFLIKKENAIYGDYTVAREEVISPVGSNTDFLNEVKKCLLLETGNTRLYTLTKEDLTKEEILEKAELISREYLSLPEYPLDSAYVYGEYYELGLCQMEWASTEDERYSMSMEARTGMLISAECQKDEPLNQEELIRFLDYYIDWQIYFSDQPSREQIRDGFSEKMWLSAQNIGFAVTQIRDMNGSWQISLQLFQSTN